VAVYGASDALSETLMNFAASWNQAESARSALGQSRRFENRPATSDLPQSTDIARPAWLVRLVPKPDLVARQRQPRFNEGTGRKLFRASIRQLSRSVRYPFTVSSVSPLNFVPFTHRSSSLTRVSRGKRSTRVPSAILASMRASCSPMHWWIPPPNPTCLFRKRAISNSSGFSNVRGSRFA
jgi:hypothetical protein